MKKFLVIIMVMLFAVMLVAGCGQKQEEDAGKVPADVKQAEQMDSTRLDSAMLDSTMEEIVPDSVETP